MRNDEFMSKRTPRETFMTGKALAEMTNPLEQREALINGTAVKGQTESRADFVCITERHGQRQLRLSHISQVVKDAGQIGGPWFVRIDGQQLPVSEANASLILGLLGLTMEEAKA
jgi:hypothetical protein